MSRTEIIKASIDFWRNNIVNLGNAECSGNTIPDCQCTELCRNRCGVDLNTAGKNRFCTCVKLRQDFNCQGCFLKEYNLMCGSDSSLYHKAINARTYGDRIEIFMAIKKKLGVILGEEIKKEANAKNSLCNDFDAFKSMINTEVELLKDRMKAQELKFMKRKIEDSFKFKK